LTNACSVYLRLGVVFIPTTARTKAGYYLEVEPVTTVPLLETDQVVAALIAALGRENPVVETPTRDNFPKWVVPPHAKVKSRSAFYRLADFWSIRFENGSFVISSPRKDGRGWVGDPSRSERVTGGAESVAQRMVQLLASASR